MTVVPASARPEVSHRELEVLRAVLRRRLRDLGRTDQAGDAELEEVDLITGVLRRAGPETVSIDLQPVEVRLVVWCLDLLPNGPGAEPGLPTPAARHALRRALHGPERARRSLQRLLHGLGLLAP